MKKLNREMTEFFERIFEGERKLLVYGDGSRKARIMLIGEAPGEFEVKEGKPFVGKAGKNLDDLLLMAGIRRDELYITNVVKFRPVKKSKADRLVNRPPTREEIELFLPWLNKEIGAVSPKLIVTLGNVPLRALLGKNERVGELHGRFIEANKRTYYPMYHPASLIYNPSLKELYFKDIERLAAWSASQTGKK